MTELIVCPGCQRHVRAGESTCPFCGAAPAACAQPCAPAAARRRPSRTLLLATGVVAAGMVACGSAHPVYGAPIPPQDAATDQQDGAAPADAPPDSSAPEAGDR